MQKLQQREERFLHNLTKSLSGNVSLKQLWSVPEDLIDEYYTIASNFFKKKHYHDAADAFLFLTVLDPYNSFYWIGLGMAEHRCGNHDMSLRAFSTAVLMDIDNPTPHLYAAEVYCAMHDYTNAVKSLDLVVACVGDNSDYLSIKGKAIEIRRVIAKRFNIDEKAHYEKEHCQSK